MFEQAEVMQRENSFSSLSKVLTVHLDFLYYPNAMVFCKWSVIFY